MGLGEDEAFVLQAGGAEIQQYCPLQPGRSEVMDDLRIVGAGQPCERLQLDNDRLKTQEIDPIPAG